MKKGRKQKMNTQELEILKNIDETKYITQRELVNQTGCSLGRINKGIKTLVENGYLTHDMRLTQKSRKLFEECRPDNAIILAAGYGMRMVPINTEISKGLLEIKGQPLIEHLIEQLHQVGVERITVVVGFLKESYEYLIDKYNIELKINMDYSTKNNLYSLEKACAQLGNTYIIPCDVYCEENPFSTKELYSWYMVTDQEKLSSDVKVNRKGELVRVKEGEFGDDMLGIAYITKSDGKIIRERLEKYCGDGLHEKSFWEEILYNNEKMLVSAKKVSHLSNYEINTFEQLRQADQNSDNLKSEIMALIAKTFHTEQTSIKNITVLKKGMTNRSFQFELNHERYIMRIPGQGTDKLINRKQEYEVYDVIKDLGICDDIYYINPDNGYKITKYIEDAENCDDSDWTKISKCMAVLRDFHHKKLWVNHTFDLFEQIEFYESLWKGDSCYKDYAETKQNVYRLKDFIESQEKVWTLTHIDANADNFLLWKDKEEKENITLIDWEYAAMQDAHLDIAMFAIYSMYDRENVDRLIDCYFENCCSKENRLKIYAYIAISGLLWSNWCEYKRQKGQEFGEYSIKQYRYAKEYSRLVLNTLEEEQE